MPEPSLPRPTAPGLERLLDDQSRRWSAERPPVEDYLRRHPDVHADRELVLDLIYHEILLRKRHGEAPQLDEYAQRFPAFATELAVQFQVDAACSRGEPLPGLQDASFPTIGKAAASSSSSWLARAAGVNGVALARLLAADLRNRWEKGEAVRVESYLQQLPRLESDSTALVELISAEVALRRDSQEPPSLAEYLSRFPGQESELRRLLSLLPTGDSAMTPAAASVGATVSYPPPSPSDTPEPDGWATVAREIPPSAPADRAEKTQYPAIPGYEILCVLGRGGMGIVYRALQVGLKRQVALKMILQKAHASPDQVERFQAEAEAVARLQHPNIVQIYEVGEHDGAPYFSLEFVSGGALDRRIKGTPQPPQQSAELVEKLARAVHAAHEHNIIHRDLKPANVLLSADGTPKVTDFGLAKQLDAESGQTQSGDVVGTPSYMSPEQAFGKIKELGPPTDIYALGAILYDMLTGRPPFKGGNVIDTLALVVSEEPVPPRRLQPKCPLDLETICLKCLAKEPEKRYDSAAALADDLHRYLAGEPIQARPTGHWERAWKWVRRHPTLSGVTAACVLTLAVLAAAHYIHLRAALAQALGDQERTAAARQAEGLLHKAEAAVNTTNWTAASDSLAEARGLLKAQGERFADDQVLAELRGRVDQLQEQTRQRLTDQDRYRALVKGRDDAAFHATRLTGLDPKTNRDRTRAIVEPVLKLFGVALDGTGTLVLAGDYLTAEQKTEIAEGAYELLLDLADVEAEARPGGPADEPRRQAQQALGILDRAAALGPRSAVWHQRRARYLAQAGDAAAAAEELKRVAGDQRDRPFEYFLQGADLHRDGKLTEAIQRFEKVLAVQKSHLGAQYAIAVCYLKLRGPNRELDRVHRALAVARLGNCIDQQPDRLWPYLLRGYGHSELDQFPAAEADFAQVELLLGNQPDETARYGVLVNRGFMRIRQDNLAGAVTDLTAAVKLKPEEVPAHVNLAQAYERQGQWTEAIKELDRAVALKPSAGLAAVFRHRARLHLLQKEPAAALLDFDRAIQADPRGLASPAVAEDLFEKGKVLIELRKYPEAVEALDAFLAFQPNQAAAHRLRAEALLFQDKAAEAVVALTRYLDLDLEKRKAAAAAYQARGKAQLRLGDAVAATEDFSRALELEPENAPLYGSRGWAFVVLDAPTLAVRDFEKVLQIEPGNADALNGRGFCKARLGDYAQAAADTEKALSSGAPRDVRLLYNAARTYSQSIVAVARAEVDTPTTALRDLRLRNQKRALALVRDALDQLPAEQRPRFWQQTIQPDTAMNPLRRTAEFLQLQEQLGKSPAKN